MLSDCMPGGTWSSTTPAVATIGSTTGMITGVTAGTTTIFYQLTSGCNKAINVTINPSPATVTGTLNICPGSTSSLADGTPGGAWSSANTAVATVGSTGISTAGLTGVAAGTAVISYTLPTGCTATRIATVYALPTSYIVTGGGAFCAGGGGSDIGLSGSELGVNYQLFRGSTGVGSPLPGNGTALDFGFQTISGTYYIRALNASTGCVSNMTGSAIIVVNPMPTLYTMTGGGNMCPGGTGYPVGLSGSNTGINYQLYLGGSFLGPAVPGTGAALDFGIQTVGGAYSVVATNPVTSCYQTMTGIVNITVYSLPYAYNVTGGGNYCAGGTGAHVGLSASQPGTTYTLYLGTTAITSVIGAGGAIDFGPQTAAGVYAVKAMNTVTGCVNTMTGSATVGINPLPTIYTVTGGGPYCAGGAGSHVGLNGSNTGISYQLFTGTTVFSPVSGTGSLIDFGVRTIAGPYTVVATNMSTTCTSNMAGAVTVSIIPTITPAVSISVSPNDTVCAGTTVSYAALPVNGGIAPTYTWTVNGTSAGTGSSYSYVPVNTDLVGVTMLSSAACATPATVSATQYMTVNPYPSVTGPTWICLGATVVMSGTIGGTWTSSNPGVATIAIGGTMSGVINTVSAGVTIISYTRHGCVTTTVVTVNPLPAISVTQTAECGGITTLTGLGGTSYSWSPTVGLSCSSCASADANPPTTLTYTVTGTDGAGCSETASVTVNGNRINGFISYSGTPADTMKVWLIQFNSFDSSLTALDSTMSCMAGGTPYFEFGHKPSGSYMVKAKLLGQTPGASGYIPTYSLSTPYWYAAASVNHSYSTDTMHINMVYGTVPPGPGFIGGLISSGAGKGTTGDIPANGMTVYLRDAVTNFIVTYTYTDASGAYSFSNIGYGTYVVYPEDFGYHTTPSAVITLSPLSDSSTGMNFKEYIYSRVIRPVYASSINTINTGTGLRVYPNPTTGLLKLHCENQETEQASILITDLVGREAFRSVMNIDRQYETEVNLSALKSGVYLISVKSEHINYCGKVMVE
jgi:Secretion system C-terminal sorting domain